MAVTHQVHTHRMLVACECDEIILEYIAADRLSATCLSHPSNVTAEFEFYPTKKRAEHKSVLLA